ncbi:PilX N-terminal domain-containing pilus assembly protein [Roseateles sp.]|uniref:PilX N-terminal domain-containing pilus assembly protein n=1 Tax=Roseateles sp. TaxID=1971397 RepID=UPI0025FB2163|nr:PilX N-terminal domain-containing pilus assembly protein [Roseateles sp.]MBV8035692.1 hypothetical protein [Roseateles sp.]
MRRGFGVGRSAQNGAATLVVVMVLFLVMALLAAYANRSLMFEQRISGSYYRASLAQEMAEGGVEWTVAMLNGTGIDASCQPVSSGGTRFADKYLAISSVDRSVQSKTAAALEFAVDCARTGNTLVCRCPAPNDRTAQPATTVQGLLVPSFGLALGTDVTLHYGSFQVTSQGCSDSSVDNCRTDGAEGRSPKAIATSVQTASIAFIAAVPSSPASPLTVKGSLTTTGSGGLGLHNTDPASSGLLVVSGGTAPALVDARMDSVPGTPPAQARIFDDAGLSSLSADWFFRTYMGMAPSRYQNHPSLRVVTCPAGDCGPALQAAYAAGQRILWIAGPMTIASNVVIGAVNDPPLIIVNGNVVLSGPMQINGMLVALGDLAWSNTGGLTSLITGMVLVQGDMTATGSMDIQYLQSIANQLRNRQGSYARVSGSLIDAD